MKSPSDVDAIAKHIPGMTAFFALIGGVLATGGFRRAYAALILAGVDAKQAWMTVDKWQDVQATQAKTGWTPEYLAMHAAIRADLANCRRVDWDGLAVHLIRSGRPDGGVA